MTKVIQNNTGMYTKESSQQTFKIPNNISLFFKVTPQQMQLFIGYLQDMAV